jgi:hypothetical protein
MKHRGVDRVCDCEAAVTWRGREDRGARGGRGRFALIPVFSRRERGEEEQLERRLYKTR